MKKLLFIFALVCLYANTQIVCKPVFDYPFTPNSKEWNSYKSVKDRAKALEISQNILSQISTGELLDICLRYPYLVDIMCHDTPQEGLIKVSKHFNGLNELLKRDDVIDAIFKKSMQLPDDISAVAKRDSIEKGRLSFCCFVAELILLNDDVLSKISEEQAAKVLKVISTNYKMKSQHSEIFKSFNEFPSALLKKKMESINKLSGSLKLAASYNPNNYVDTTMYTPYNNIIPGTKIYDAPDVAVGSTEFTYLMQQLYSLYNTGMTFQMVDFPSYKYNCHGYAWHVYQGGSYVWINGVPHVFWDDGTYEEVPESLATHVVYTGDHSAIRINDNLYQSKWGSLALVKHQPNNVPASYEPEETKRFFRKKVFTISGPTFICNSATYNVSTSSGETVSWSYTPIQCYSGAHPSISTPTSNTCILQRIYPTSSTEGILKASISVNGHHLGYSQRLVRCDQPFSCIYWEYDSDELCDEHIVTFGDDNSAVPGRVIIMESECFRGKTVTLRSSSYPLGIPLIVSGNQVSFEMQYQAVSIEVYGDGSCNNVTFTINTTTGTNGHSGQLTAKAIGDNKYILSVNDADMEKWDFNVFQVHETSCSDTYKVVSGDYLLDASTWKPGIYIIRANANGKIYTGKISIGK